MYFHSSKLIFFFFRSGAEGEGGDTPSICILAAVKRENITYFNPWSQQVSSFKFKFQVY